MSPLFVIFGILAIIIPVGLCIFYKNKIEDLTTDNGILKKRNETLEERFNAEDAAGTIQEVSMNAYDFLKAMGQRNQFEIEELDRNENWITSAFSYQGGNFVCFTGVGNDEFLLQFRGVIELTYTPANYEKVRTACLRFTEHYRYTKFFHSYDDKENQLAVHIAIETIHPTEAAFMHYIHLCFRLASEIREYLEKGDVKSEEERMDDMRDLRMLVDAEMKHEAKALKVRKPDTKAPNHGTLNEYLSYLFQGEQMEDLLLLRIQTSADIEEIRQRDKIAAFDILSCAVRDDENGVQFTSYEPVVLTLDAVANHYVFTLHPLKSGQEFMTVRMTAVCTPHEFLQNYVPNATYEPEAISMLLCYVKTELPALEGDDVETPTTSNAKQFNHGRQLMQQNCFVQAIAVLTPINKQLRANFFKLSKKEQELYFSTCYYLGFCYTDLHLYEKAHYYLSTAHDCNRFDYSQEYINCLAEGRDPRIFNVIDEEVQATRNQLDQIDKDEDRGSEEMMSHREHLVNYYAFLQRRRGYSQINFGYLDEAADTFKHLLDHEGSREYAEHELKYIETLKNK